MQGTGLRSVSCFVIFSLSSQWLREKFSLSVLKFVLAVGQEGIPTMGRRCYRRFSYQSSSGAKINGRPYHICCGSPGQVFSRGIYYEAEFGVTMVTSGLTLGFHCHDGGSLFGFPCRVSI